MEYIVDLSSIRLKFRKGVVMLFPKLGETLLPFHASLFSKPEPKTGTLRPHFREDLRGRRGRRKDLGSWLPQEVKAAFDRFGVELGNVWLKKRRRVDLAELEREGWVADAVPDEVSDSYYASKKASFKNGLDLRGDRLEAFLREETEGILDLADEHLVPPTALDEMAVKYPKRGTFGLRRYDEEGNLQCALVGHLPGEEPGQREWWLTPCGSDWLTPDEMRELMTKAFPPSFWKALIRLNRWLSLKGDAPKLQRLLERSTLHFGNGHQNPSFSK